MPPKNQTGEGIVVVLDVGLGVSEGTGTTFFTQAKECLQYIIQRKIFAEKCYDHVGIVLFGTAGTENRLAGDNQYLHVTVLQELKLVDWKVMRKVEELRSSSSSGDWLDALVVAMDLLHNADRVFSGKKIVLLTDFSGEFCDDHSCNITSGLRSEGIELVVIGPDILKNFIKENESEDQTISLTDDDRSLFPSNNPPLNWNGKPKTMVQLAGEAVVSKIVAKAEGMLCSFEDARPQLVFFEKMNQSSSDWNTTLDIGSDFKIPISGEIKVREISIPTWEKSNRHSQSEVISTEVSYHLYDGSETEVREEEVIDAYHYGATLVPCSDVDMKMQYQSNSPRSLSVLGFTESKNVPHHLRVGNQVLMVTARDSDEEASVALSALIRAMAEMDMVAITRRVYNKNFDPSLGALFPEITKDCECLYWIQLPFQQDVLQHVLPSLRHQMDQLKNEEKDAIDSLIDAMSLSQGEGDDDDDDEEEEEELNPTNILDPSLQYYYNLLTHRALYPDDKELPKPSPCLQSILEPPERVCELRDKVATKLKSLFPTEVLVTAPKRTKNVFDVQDEDKVDEKKAKRSDSPTNMLLDRVTKVTTASPVQDFMALLKEQAPNFRNICSQMEDVVLQLVHSLPGIGNSAVAAATLDKVLDCLTTFRQESCAIDPENYNKFLTRLKDSVVSFTLTDLWERLKEGSLGLITSEEHRRSTVGSDEASTFLQLNHETPKTTAAVEESGGMMEDLLDDL